MSEKCNIWFINQYAMPPEYEFRARNNLMAKYLLAKGHNVLIIGGSTLHNRNEFIDTGTKSFVIRKYDDLTFAHIKILKYRRNSLKRMISLIQFQLKLSRLAKRISVASGNSPDVVICDGAPLPFYRAIKVAKRLGAKAIKEVRDLWPESLVAYGYLKRNSILAKYLYRFERLIYEQSDALVFAMEGGADYIVARGWDKGHGGNIDLKKVFHINNGVDLEAFDKNADEHKGFKSNLFGQDSTTLIYAGSIRNVNALDLLIKPVADSLEQGLNIRLILVGEGDERFVLEEKYADHIDSIVITGEFQKEYIPALLRQADICVVCSRQASVCNYGLSQNKIFDYMAAGKPILSLVQSPYNPVIQYRCGIEADSQAEEDVIGSIRYLIQLSPEEVSVMEANAREAASDFDLRKLTEKLVQVIEYVIQTPERVVE